MDEADGLGESMGDTAAEDSVESVTLRRREAFTGRGTAVEAMAMLSMTSCSRSLRDSKQRGGVEGKKRMKKKRRRKRKK